MLVLQWQRRHFAFCFRGEIVLLITIKVNEIEANFVIFLRKSTKMTAHDQMRAMLDQLMGTGRNGKAFF